MKMNSYFVYAGENRDYGRCGNVYVHTVCVCVCLQPHPYAGRYPLGCRCTLKAKAITFWNEVGDVTRSVLIII